MRDWTFELEQQEIDDLATVGIDFNQFVESYLLNVSRQASQQRINEVAGLAQGLPYDKQKAILDFARTSVLTELAKNQDVIQPAQPSPNQPL